MSARKLLTFLYIFCLFPVLQAQSPLIRFHLETKNLKVDNIPVSVSVTAGVFQNPGEYTLFEVSGSSEIMIPFQADPANPPVIWFILPPGRSDDAGKRNFIIEKETTEGISDHILSMSDQTSLTLFVKDSPVLKYQMGVMEAPAGTNSLYRRSGFIHPLWSPAGEVLTAIQPVSHYHHYGIWNPWTKTIINGGEVDFWNLAKAQGTVRYKALLSQTEGPVFGGFKAYHEHIDLQAEKDSIALNEIWDVRVWNRTQETSRQIIDFKSTFTCPLASGIVFAVHRYGGGLGYRATEQWNGKNCSIITSEGKTRKNADDTRARWTIIEGQTGQGRSGILFLSHPFNYEHPEPIRVWPPDTNNGKLFFNISPTKRNEWKIEPKSEHILRYRIIVFDGKMSIEEAEDYWRGFAGKDIWKCMDWQDK